MHTQSLEESPRNRRGGQVSYLLLAGGQFGSRDLAVTWVDGEPGSEQPVHGHPEQEQVYVIVRGRGAMRVGDEEREVSAGTLVYVPPRSGHAIRNTGDEPLVYVSATAPPFELAPAGSVFAYEPTPGR
ncbi:MAG TPA: cupin domain-containing protein [Dehalococcoidia bacterium]|nr:cupin domain-containing protein [Dehalococcoidia bacterium]